MGTSVHLDPGPVRQPRQPEVTQNCWIPAVAELDQPGERHLTFVTTVQLEPGQADILTERGAVVARLDLDPRL
jgi:hypothetical protein